MDRINRIDRIEIGLCGVVGGMMWIELLAGTMRWVRGRIAAVEDDMRQTYTVKHIRKGLTLLSYFYSNVAIYCGNQV